MEKSEYIQIQDEAWELIESYTDTENKTYAVEALKKLSVLKIAVDNGKNVLLYQQAKTLLGIAMCLVFLDDSVDALKVFDELESLTPSFLTPRKDELKRLKKLGREFKAECFD